MHLASWSFDFFPCSSGYECSLFLFIRFRLSFLCAVTIRTKTVFSWFTFNVPGVWLDVCERVCDWCAFDFILFVIHFVCFSTCVLNVHHINLKMPIQFSVPVRHSTLSISLYAFSLCLLPVCCAFFRISVVFLIHWQSHIFHSKPLARFPFLVARPLYQPFPPTPVSPQHRRLSLCFVYLSSHGSFGFLFPLSFGSCSFPVIYLILFGCFSFSSSPSPIWNRRFCLALLLVAISHMRAAGQVFPSLVFTWRCPSILAVCECTVYAIAVYRWVQVCLRFFLVRLSRITYFKISPKYSNIQLLEIDWISMVSRIVCVWGKVEAR